MRTGRPDVRLTKHEEFSVEDWKDLFETLRAFKLRVLQRHYGGASEKEILANAHRFQRHRPRLGKRARPIAKAETEIEAPEEVEE